MIFPNKYNDLLTVLSVAVWLDDHDQIWEAAKATVAAGLPLCRVHDFIEECRESNSRARPKATAATAAAPATSPAARETALAVQTTACAASVPSAPALGLRS